MDQAAAPTRPLGPSPLRRPGSVRRTSTIDTSWPQGISGEMVLTGRARDLLTPSDGTPPRVLAEGGFVVRASPLREILAISIDAPGPHAQQLVGARAGGKLRAVLGDIMPEERSAGTPLYLILDDLSGASLVAYWAWSRWDDAWLNAAAQGGQTSTAGRNGKMEGVCIAFTPGSSALEGVPGSSFSEHSGAAVPPLPHPDDRPGWHDLPAQTGCGMRRARRIDVWLDGAIRIDSSFQDSATVPQGGRRAVHEYRLSAEADPATGKISALHADPRILPYKECPAAAANVQVLVGSPLATLRMTVLDTLAGTKGCTHLNDALRALAEVPILLNHALTGE